MNLVITARVPAAAGQWFNRIPASTGAMRGPGHVQGYSGLRCSCKCTSFHPGFIPLLLATSRMS